MGSFDMGICFMKLYRPVLQLMSRASFGMLYNSFKDSFNFYYNFKSL